MSMKLTTPGQIASLRKGDIIRRFPSNTNNKPEETFDKERRKDIDTYVIESINAATGIIGLVMTGDSLSMFSSPGDVGRLFIQSGSLVTEKVWWNNQ